MGTWQPVIRRPDAEGLRSGDSQELVGVDRAAVGGVGMAFENTGERLGRLSLQERISARGAVAPWKRRTGIDNRAAGPTEPLHPELHTLLLLLRRRRGHSSGGVFARPVKDEELLHGDLVGGVSPGWLNLAEASAVAQWPLSGCTEQVVW